MIDLTNESGTPVDEQGLVALAGFCLEQLRIHPQAELSLVVVDSPTMAGYHERFLGEPGPTDVLSFPMDELRMPRPGDDPPLGLLGDVVLCPEVIAAGADDTAAQTQYLLVHGLLHLLGFDHGTESEKAEMFELTDRLLADYRARQ